MGYKRQLHTLAYFSGQHLRHTSTGATEFGISAATVRHTLHSGEPNFFHLHSRRALFLFSFFLSLFWSHGRGQEFPISTIRKVGHHSLFSCFVSFSTPYHGWVFGRVHLASWEGRIQADLGFLLKTIAAMHVWQESRHTIFVFSFCFFLLLYHPFSFSPPLSHILSPYLCTSSFCFTAVLAFFFSEDTLLLAHAWSSYRIAFRSLRAFASLFSSFVYIHRHPLLSVLFFFFRNDSRPLRRIYPNTSSTKRLPLCKGSMNYYRRNSSLRKARTDIFDIRDPPGETGFPQDTQRPNTKHNIIPFFQEPGECRQKTGLC